LNNLPVTKCVGENTGITTVGTGDNIDEEPVKNAVEAFVTTSQNASIVEDISTNGFVQY